MNWHGIRLRTLSRLATIVGLVSVMVLSPVNADETKTSVPEVLDLLITNAQIFDGREVLSDGPYQVHIQGHKIIALTATEELVQAKRQIDAEGRWLIPGLIDAHVHTSIPLGFLALRDADPNYIAYRSAVAAEQMLKRGFTTVRDMGGPKDLSWVLEYFPRARWSVKRVVTVTFAAQGQATRPLAM
jgi:predicted amidohydrolase YtcJ